MMVVIKDRIGQEIDFLERLINQRDTVDSDLLAAYPEWTPEWATEWKEFWAHLAGFL